MGTSLRNYCIALFSVFVVLAVFFPDKIGFIAVAGIIVFFVSYRLSIHIIKEPLRPIIFRWGQIYRLGPSGWIFLLPTVETMAECVDMSPHSHEFTVINIHDTGGSSVYLNVEIFWRLRSTIDMIDEPIKLMLLKSDTDRIRLVEQAISVVARQLVLSYRPDQIGRADIRQEFTYHLCTAVNEYLFVHGLMVESLFWRGSNTHEDINKAKREITISHEQVGGLLADMQLIQEKMPNISPEQLLAYKAYLELIRRGMPIPTLPNLGVLSAPPLPVRSPTPPMYPTPVYPPTTVPLPTANATTPPASPTQSPPPVSPSSAAVVPPSPPP